MSDEKSFKPSIFMVICGVLQIIMTLIGIKWMYDAAEIFGLIAICWTGFGFIAAYNTLILYKYFTTPDKEKK
jgi:arginine exporter protein ArgO